MNPALEVDQHPIPKPEGLFASLSGGQCFSTLDLTQAYQRLVLDEESQELVTINTYLELYHFNRLLPQPFSNEPWTSYSMVFPG